MITVLDRPPVVDDIGRRTFLTGIGAAGVLAGCAGPRPATSVGAAPGFPRTVAHLGGSLDLPAPPQRIALTSARYLLDELLLLDAVPLAYAASDSEELAVWTRNALAARGGEVQNYNGAPYPEQPDYELLATLAPDLIVAFDLDTDETLETLRGIAPVLQVAYTDTSGGRLRTLAAALGREDRIAAIEATSTALLDTVTPLASTLAVVFGYRDGAAAAQVYNGDGRSELAVLERAGFVLADFDRPADERDFVLTEENFAQLDVQALWNVAPYPGDASAEQFESSPVLQNLAVLREGRYRRLTADQSQAILFWTPLATPFLVETLNALVATYPA